MNDLFLRACRREPVERPPVWMMRQAGRYLPEYRAVRERADFLTMVGTPELAVQVTLQPVDMLGVDAAIIFSDILVIPQAMGMELSVDEGIGPRFHQPLRSPADFDRLRDPSPDEDLGYVLDALRLARQELAGRVPLIGFAGAPWTLMSYMVEGQGSKSFTYAKRLLVQDPARAHALLARLARAVGAFLVAQVRAGAQAVQVFDSWASALGPRDFREFALPYLAQSVRIARSAGVPGDRVRTGRGVGPGGDRRGHRRRRDRRRLADGRGGGSPTAGRSGGRAAGQPGPLLAVRAAGHDPEAHARDAGRVRGAGAHRQPGARHPSRRTGGARPGLRRGGAGVACAVSRVR